MKYLQQQKITHKIQINVPIERCKVKEVLCICVVQYSKCHTCVVMEYLKFKEHYRGSEIELFNFINLNFIATCGW